MSQWNTQAITVGTPTRVQLTSQLQHVIDKNRAGTLGTLTALTQRRRSRQHIIMRNVGSGNTDDAQEGANIGEVGGVSPVHVIAIRRGERQLGLCAGINRGLCSVVKVDRGDRLGGNWQGGGCGRLCSRWRISLCRHRWKKA